MRGMEFFLANWFKLESKSFVTYSLALFNQSQLISVNNLKRVREEHSKGASNSSKVQKLLVSHPKHTEETAAKIAMACKIRNSKETEKEVHRTSTEKEKFATSEIVSPIGF